MDSNASLKSPVYIPLKSECRYYIKESIDGTLLIYLGKIVLVKASPSSYPVNNFALYLNNVPIMTGQTINFHRNRLHLQGMRQVIKVMSLGTGQFQ
jgi:hypothetical protein